MRLLPKTTKTHNMSDAQLDAQWVKSSAQRKEAIIRDAFGRRGSTELIQGVASAPDLRRVAERLSPVQVQVVVNRLAMDAGYLDLSSR